MSAGTLFDPPDDTPARGGCPDCHASFGHLTGCPAGPLPRTGYGGSTGYNPGDATSMEAAAATVRSGSAGRMQRSVLDLLSRAGPLASFEAEARLGGAHQSVSSALRNLELAGDVVRLTQTRVNPESSRRCRVYALAETAARLRLPTVAPNEQRAGASRRGVAADDALAVALAEIERLRAERDGLAEQVRKYERALMSRNGDDR